MPRLIYLEPGPLKAEVLAELRDSQVVLLSPNRFVESRLAQAGVGFAHLGSDPIGGDALLLQSRGPLDELVYIVDRLLGPGGCPWDQAQTHESLKKYLLEEAYEVLDAIDAKDDAKFCEELGDLILQPIMHGQMRSMAGGFDTDAVAQGIVDKLVRRHPHVFGEVDVADADEVLKNWDKIKQTEKGEEKASLLAGVPKGMASLLRAHEVSKRAARAGFEWPDINAVFDKLHEEEFELREALGQGVRERIESEIGDLLFTAVNIARWAGIEPEEALRKMLNRFTERFMHMEVQTEKDLRDLTPEEWDILWSQAKHAAQIS
ncbi:MAG: nucleoside triphosphate pyrophosphohydrolase [Fimbriimonas sp.]|nr:nucleoside triphosphate pyrophosphohydrolase [Fimbriimonas sp.]